MAYISPQKQKEYRLKRQQRAAAARGEVIRPIPVPIEIVYAEPVIRDWPDDAGQALAQWSREALVVPPGHPHSGRAMVVPDYIQSFVSDAMAPDTKEALLCLARKNAKTSGCAILALAHLVEGAPFANPGTRLAVVSLDKTKANELRREAEAIAVASRLPGLTFKKSPVPGHIEADNGSDLVILAGDKNAGAAGGYDLILCDEVGLFEEPQRPLLESLLGSTGARNGRVIYLSVYGNGLYTTPLIKRKDDAAVAVHVYQPAPDARLDDETAWSAGNPGLGSIKSREHMRTLCRKAQVEREYARTFRVEEMNLPGSASKENIVELSAWTALGHDQPPRDGRCLAGRGHRRLVILCVGPPPYGRTAA